MASFIGDLVSSVIELPQWFAGVAAADPLSAVLLVLGAVITGASVAVIGVLALGALGSLLAPEVSEEPRRPA